MNQAKSSSTRHIILLIVATSLTVTFVVALATNVAPWLRGPKEWRWVYAIPGTVSRLWLPALVLVLYLLGSAWLVPGLGDLASAGPARRRVVLALLLSMAMTPAIQLALLFMDHPDVRAQLFYRTVSEGANGFFNVGAVIMDRHDFLNHFAERMLSWYPTHPQRHPPGLPLLFSLARTFFDARPAVTERLNEVYRPYQCHNVALMNLPDGAIASATAQMALPIVMSLVVWPLYRLGKEVYDQATAVRAVLLWPLVPGIALWAAFWTPLYALFTVLSFLLFHYGLSRRNLLYLYLSGVIVSVASFLSLGNLAIAGFLGLYALVRLTTMLPRPRWRWLLWGALCFVLGAATLWLGLWLMVRLSFFAVWSQAMGRHLEMKRVGWFWILYQLYDFLVASAGVPILVFWVAGTGAAAYRAWRRHKPVDVLSLAFLLGLLALDLSGAARGEVARVWAFILPLPVLVAVSCLNGRRVLFLGLMALTGLNLFVANMFVRYVGTDLTDPPAAPPSVVQVAPAEAWLATWSGGISLQATQPPATAVAGQPLTVRTVWTTARQVNHPYTVFLHLYDLDGNLVTNVDEMPLRGQWPTTCWRPGQSFEDSYTLTVPDSLPPATYRLKLGLYWLPTGERLPIDGRGMDALDLGTIEISAATQ
jgi:hypothetical protein